MARCVLRLERENEIEKERMRERKNERKRERGKERERDREERFFNNAPFVLAQHCTLPTSLLFDSVPTQTTVLGYRSTVKQSTLVFNIL